MNIVIIDDGYRKGDDRTRINFLKKLSNFKDVKLYLITLFNIDIVKAYNPDILFFPMYEPSIRKTWPDDLFDLGIATVVLEEDHYETKFESLVYSDREVLNWYKEKGISLLLRRHCYEEKAPVESAWLPFSANEEEFYPIKNGITSNIIGFAGSYQSNQIYYDVRRKAIEILGETHLLDIHFGKIYEGYAQYLREHAVGLACTGGILHTPLAKTFEIPLSRSALLTNSMDHTNLLWGDEKCYFEYKDDCSNIVEVAEEALLNYKEIANNSRERVLKYHTDFHRIKELYAILKALVGGKNIPRKWGQ